ncbi:MAG: hypothetical protein EP329_26985 [Deltaproteobacteria bacterium]|nr:MAG: hypothetical protein EP329_26985 [Deltaproteobacteria bacterium]
MFRPALLALATFLAVPLGFAPSDASARNPRSDLMDIRKVQLEFLAFNEDSDEYLVKVIDEQIGTVLQVRSTKDNELVKAYPYQLDAEERTIKRVRKKHNLTQDPHEDPANPKKKTLTLLLGQKDDKLVIYVMKGDRIKKYDEIDVLKDKDGNVAKASMKQLVWDQRGKNVVIIFHQKFPGDHAWQSDFVYSFKFKSYKAKFDDGDASDDEE